MGPFVCRVFAASGGSGGGGGPQFAGDTGSNPYISPAALTKLTPMLALWYVAQKTPFPHVSWICVRTSDYCFDTQTDIKDVRDNTEAGGMFTLILMPCGQFEALEGESSTFLSLYKYAYTSIHMCIQLHV